MIVSRITAENKIKSGTFFSGIKRAAEREGRKWIK